MNSRRANSAEMAREDSQQRREGLLGWAARQVWAFIALVSFVVIQGLVSAIIRRRFHWGAFFAAVAVMAVGTGAIVVILNLPHEQVQLNDSSIIWGVSMAMMAVAGFLAGRVGRRIGYWEIYLATLIFFVAVFIHMAKGWHVILGFGPGPGDGYFEYLMTTAPGEQLLGSMWDRMLGLGFVTSFLLAIFGGSIAFLFFSDEGKLNSRFDFEWLISRRHLLTSHRRGLISVTAIVAVVGVAVGVATLVAVTAVMSGYQEDIQEKILSTNAHFVVQKYGLDFTEYRRIEALALESPEVVAASPFVFNEAMLATDARGLGVLFKGVVPSEAGQVTGIERNLCKAVTPVGECVRFAPGTGPHLPQMLGRMAIGGELDDGEHDEQGATGATEEKPLLPGVVVGLALFEKIGKPVGSVVTLTTPVGIAGARGNAPKRMDVRIGGVFKSGMHDFDARLLYTDLQSAQRLMGLGEAVTGVELKVRDPERVELVARDVYRAVGTYPYRTLDWRELNIGIFTALRLQKIVMFLVLAFIIVVAAFNIASTLFMAVVEKAHEIAVLKSMGSRDSSIMKVFVMEGWAVGGIGTVIGLALGLLVCALMAELDIGIAADVYMVGSLKVRVQFLEVGLTAVAAMIISHLATLYPALKAARQRPVDAMRYD